MDLKDLKGIKEAREKLFNNLDIFNIEDLLNFFPAKYYNLSQINDINIKESPKIIKAKILSKTKKGYKKAIVTAKALSQNKTIDIVWFNQPYIYNKLEDGKEYVFFGKCTYDNIITFYNPLFEQINDVKKLKGILPIYKTCNELSQNLIISAIKDLLKKIKIKSIIPSKLIQKYNLINLQKAYNIVHNPNSIDNISNCVNTIAIEILYNKLINFHLQNNTKQKRNVYYNNDINILNDFIKNLDFTLTKSQKNSINEIIGDLNSDFVMNRLLQGDVGSGKTIVAYGAMYYVAKCGGQCVFIAPTQLLARQQYLNALKIFKDYNFDIQLLTGSINENLKKTIIFNIKNNVCNMVFATHSVLSDNVEFANLSLVVCDEQHRFGVKQRSIIKNKGKQTDMLIMSATPMPRSLNLVMFGELAVSTLKDKPQNRKKVNTHIVIEEKINDMYNFVKELIKEGKQVYIVTRNIDSEQDDRENVKNLYKNLKSKDLKGIKTGLLHGRMKDCEKADIMNKFINNEISVLISTTIIEVGIDVQNAAVIIIYEADKFGLAQLHQLRGRVGRADIKSYCFLLYNDITEDGIERLKALKDCNDGFVLAEKDLKLRGAGDFLGHKQHGTPYFDIKNLKIEEDTIKNALKIYNEAIKDIDYIKALQNNYMDKNLKDIILN